VVGQLIDRLITNPTN